LDKLSVVHFHPLERYPPVLNFLNFASNKCKNRDIIVFSSKSKKDKSIKEKGIKYYRKCYQFGESKFPIISYFYFNLYVLIRLLINKPKEILYYETVSSLSVIFYKKIFNKKVKVFVHFHEYTSAKEYEKGTTFWKWLYFIEKKSLNSFQQISHTNEKRMELFLSENTELNKSNLSFKIYPNYPPESWNNFKRSDNSKILKFVYVGYSVNEKTNYIREIIKWLSVQIQETILDIYCHDPDSLPKDLLGQRGSVTINLIKPISYQKIPEILSNYQIGLILYKGHTLNYIHNAPNKLFEYLACGLDVWYPEVMVEPKKYNSNETPKVINLNFNNLDKYNLAELIQPSETIRKVEYTFESVYFNLLDKLVES
jgi:hypothetical protein